MIHCLILAAGEGKRLRPFTNDQPKGLVSFLGKPLIKYQTDVLKALAIYDIAISTGYKAEKFSQLGFQTYYNPLFDTTNMVESLFSARSFLEKAKGDLLISYGDIIYEKKNLETVLTTEGDVVVMVDSRWHDLWAARNENPLNDAETLKYGKNGQIIELGKKPKSLDEIEGQYTGLIKVKHNKIANLIEFYDQLDRALLYNDRAFQQMYMTSFLQLMIESGWMVVPAKVANGWLEFDTVADLSLYKRLSDEKKLNALWRVDA